MQSTATTTTIVPTTPIPLIDLSLISTIFFFVIVIGIFFYYLQRSINSQKGPDFSSMKPSLPVHLTLLFIIALFAPSAFNYYPLGGYYASLHLIAMSWQLVLSPYSYFTFDFVFFLIDLPFMFLRIVFVYFIYRYYFGKTTKERVSIIGILSELLLPVMSLVILPIGMSNPFVTVMLSIPIPILLIAGLLILKVVPRPRIDSDWIGADAKGDWWAETDATN